MTNVYEIITDKIVNLLEAGTVPWRQPWTQATAPRSIHGTPYRGINVFLLQVESMTHGYTSPFWITYKQAKKMGGNVRKGEKSTMIILWKAFYKDVEQPDGSIKKERIPMVRYFRVFNLDQVDGVTAPKIASTVPTVGDDFDPVAEAEAIMTGFANAPKVTETGDAAYYNVGSDVVTLPPRATFVSEASFYSTAFHELTHSTAHPSRLNRKVRNPFGSHDYGREELVAEMGAAFLMAQAGLIDDQIDQSAAYLSSWIRTIREDVKAVIVAAAQAQKAADLILGVTFDKTEGDETEAETASETASAAQALAA